MVTDTEWLNERQLLRIDPCAVKQPLDRHREVVAESSFPLDTHRLVVDAGIHITAPAGITGPAVEIRVSRHQHSFFDPIWILADFHNLGCEFMSDRTRIADICGLAAVGSQVTSADPSADHFQ